MTTTRECLRTIRALIRAADPVRNLILDDQRPSPEAVELAKALDDATHEARRVMVAAGWTPPST